MSTMQSALGDFELARYPVQARDTLQAWDAADELVLAHFIEQCGAHFNGHLLIINDSFGALSVALAAYKPMMLSDSYLAQQATLANLQQNHLAPQQVTLLNSTEPLQGMFDVVILKLPKHSAMLEHQLHQLRGHVRQDTLVLAAAMTRAIHTSTLKLFENILGATRTSLAKKKARLIFCQPDTDKQLADSPYPQHYTLALGDRDYIISNHANLFSRESLDIGTRFLLQHMPQGEYKSIIDLGCGNGVLGLIAAELHPDAELLFVDESYMAIASAQENFLAAFAGARQARFETTDCLVNIASETADLILNNPPFHQQHAISDQIALRMFHDARRVLKPQGELWVIGNRHLNYHAKLKQIFGHCQLIASNRKFVILKATKG